MLEARRDADFAGISFITSRCRARRSSWAAAETFDQEVRLYERTSGTRLDPEIRDGVFVSAMALSKSADNGRIAEHLVLWGEAVKPS